MFRNKLIKASKKSFEAEIEKHITNVEVMLNNTVGVGEHSDIMETNEKEIDIIASYEDKLAIVNKYFKEV